MTIITFPIGNNDVDAASVKHPPLWRLTRPVRAARRRHRTIDPFASPDAVRLICQSLRERLPEVIPKSEKELLRFLYAVRHIERRPATNTRRGRPSHRARENLMKAAGQLRTILERETEGRVSLSSFIVQYLPCFTSLSARRKRSLRARSTFMKRHYWHDSRRNV